MSNEKFVEYIRQCGKSIMDNAEKIANSFDYQTELDKGIMEGDSVLIVKRDSE